jgi:GT2 family glycosyltransferase
MPEATVVIVTRNRKEKAQIAIESALAQTGDVEVLVMDDGSTDGTADFVRQHFPQVKLFRSEQQMGYVVHRSDAARHATAPILVSIDDDAIFVGNGVVSEAVRMFDDPRIGAVAIRHENYDVEGKVETFWPPLPNDHDAFVVKSFIGTAYALRRDLFLQLGGFQNYLFHWGEETEYCQRLYGSGHDVRMANSGLVHHFPHAVGKYTRKVNRYVTRNLILIVWLNAPAMYVLPFMIGIVGRSLLDCARHPRRATTILEGLAMGFASIFGGWRLRKPISLRRYQTWMYLRKHVLGRLDDIAERLGAAPAPVNSTLLSAH